MKKTESKYNKIAIICSGDDYDKTKIINYCSKSDYIIACDGGLNLLDKLSIIPNLIIGDMDSINKQILEKYSNIPKEVYQKEKAFTDSELGLQKAIELNPKYIYMLAATGSYIDHSFANIINLFKNINKKIEIEIITKNSIIFPIINKKIILSMIGRRFSIFPITKVKDFYMSGSKYNFDNKKNLSFADYSISNIISDNEFIINFKKGLLFFILFDEGYR